MEEAKTIQETMFPIPDYETWKMTAEKSLKEKPFEKLFTKTYEEIILQPLYTKKDVDHLHTLDSFPGFPSFVRGIEPLGYHLSPWKIAQQITAQNPLEINAQLKHDLSRGGTMVNLLVKHGTVLQTVEDMKLAFDGIDFENIPVLLDTHFCSLPVFAQFLAAFRDTQDTAKLSGTIGMDPLGALVEDGTLPVSLQKLYDLMAETIVWSHNHTPKLRTVLVKSNPYHNGGANAVQELACAVATGVEYINECLSRGIDIDIMASNITFSFSISGNLFMEIAKLRAAKILWSNVIKEYGGNTESQKMKIHAQTSTFTKTAYDPYVNILRGTTEAFAAMIGGVDSLTVSPFDVACNHSTDFSRRIARNTQLVLKDESHLDKVVDPAGGSWYVESLTSEIAEKAWSLFQQIEQIGGMNKALENSFVQSKIKAVLEKRQENLHHRKDKIVGTNFYANLNEQPLDKKIEEFPTNNSKKSDADLTKLTLAIKQNHRVFEEALAAALSGISMHEMVKVIMDGEQSISIQPIQPQRLTESFETIRKASEKYRTVNGHFPKISLINLGPLSMHKARADFITGFFEAGGFEIINNEGSYSIEECLGKYDPNLFVYVICGTDDQYIEFVPSIATEFKKYNVKLIVAGKPSEEVQAQFVETGISGFIHMMSNCYKTLKDLQREMGVSE